MEELDLARSFADAHGYFDDSFISSLQDFYDERGYLTDGQSSALENIIEKWKMREWAEEERAYDER